MTEPEALRQHRVRLLEQIGKASDEILRIDSRLRYLLEGRKPGARAVWAKENVTHDGLG
jgi:hypothetical protein